MADLFSIEARRLAVGGGQLSFLEAGEGAPLVLLHGIGSLARSWRRQLELLSRNYRVIAWNAPGYGDSTPLAAAAPDAGDYAARLLAFVDALGLARFHLVGHSLGSLMAARFAVSQSERLQSLTLASMALGHSRLEAAERERLLRSRLDDVATLGMAGMAAKRAVRLLSPQADAALVAEVTENMAALDARGYGQAARMLSGGDLLADIARLPAQLRLQFIVGDADVVTPPESNARAAALRPQALLHLVPGAGHALYLEKPEAFNALLVEFMEASQ